MQTLHDMPAQQQVELVSTINKTFLKQPVIITPQNTPQSNNMGKNRVFTVEDQVEDEDVYEAADLEMIFF